MDSNLSVEDFQTDIDFGKRDLLSQGDILVFGVLGGWVHGDLDVGGVNRQFDMSGAQAGAYAAYLKSGLFVLFKADVSQARAAGSGVSERTDATSFGVRTDTGYRFGSFRHGLFIEPLATIGLVWANLEDFKVAPNHVDFDRDPNVRGRLGLRLSTTLSAWTGTTMEPSSAACGHFVGTANGHTHLQPGHFQLRGQSDDVSDDLSAGVNFFNQSANTSVFAKFDATLGNNLEGYGGKAGIRASC